MNPHNVNEFCSQDCAARDRTRHWETGAKMYVLYAQDQPNILGVFTSQKHLERGASFITAIHKASGQVLGKLFYEVWVVNYPVEIKERDFVNIKKS